jgi:polysaccharide export outer membrane protein
MSVFFRVILLLNISIFVVGCALLPSSGPNRRDIIGDASQIVHQSSENKNAYLLVELSNKPYSPRRYPDSESLFAKFGAGRKPNSETLVGVGDIVQVTIYESGPGGLFITRDPYARADHFVQIPSQTIDRKGAIAVPYAGLIQARGRTLAAIKAEIEEKLAGRAIEPQVVVSLIGQTSAQVSVIGQMGGSAKIIMSPNGDRLTDILARASDIGIANYESYVTLVRDGKRATISFPDIINDPKENIYLLPGDVLYLYQKLRYFSVLGATTVGNSGQSQSFKIEQEYMSLLDAVGRAGGLIDNRADPSLIALFRMERREALEKIQIDLSKFPGDQKIIPTVYSANFRSASDIFAAQSFFIQDNDMVYISNSDKIEFEKAIQLFIDDATNQGKTTIPVR